MPGYGRSGRPADLYADPLRYHIHFIPKFVDALGFNQIDLMGYSMGGGISLGVALAYPALVRRLIVVSSYGLGRHVRGGKLTYIASRLPFLNGLIRRILFASPSVVKFGLQQLCGPNYTVSDDLVDEAMQTLKAHGMHPAWQAFQKVELTWGGSRTCYGEELAEINCPTLLLHGAQDRLLAAKFSRAAAQRIPNSRCTIVEDCGHMIQREQRARFSEEVKRFLGDGK